MPSTVSEMVVLAVIAAPHPLTCPGEFSQEVDSNHSTLACTFLSFDRVRSRHP